MAKNPLAATVAAQLANPPVYPEQKFEGRGIVICAGGLRYFTCAFVLLHVLRNALGCRLPVQIWHLGAAELSPAMRGLLVGQGAEIVDAACLLERHPAQIHNGWALKPYAVMHARFAEVLSLDADAVPLVDPAGVFDWPDYTATGALFWPDQVDIAQENPVWAALGLPPRRETGFETGQFVVDKRRCWEALALTVVLNNHSEQLYQMIHGEKDSFLLAFLLSQAGFTLLTLRPVFFYFDLIQLDPEGQPFIHHRTCSKYTLAGPNRPVFGDTLTQAADAALADLRLRWTGNLFHPPAMSAAAAAMVASLAGQIFLYHNSTTGAREMRLDPDFQIGMGRGDFEKHWAVIERAGGLVLQLFSSNRLAIELRKLPDGSWAGDADPVADPALAFSATLTPNTAAATMPHAAHPGAVMPAAALVQALLAAASLGAGFDLSVLAQLRAALGLLNRSHDDVPACLGQYIATNPALAASWRRALQEMQAELAASRETRHEAILHQPAPIDLLRPGFYDKLG